MKAAIMQPYLFPYVGYYQLVCSADFFVFYDDVNYIKRGYINRNNILLNGSSHRFSVPVLGASRSAHICTLNFDKNLGKVLATIHHAYSKAPYYSDVMPVIESVLTQKNRDITSVCMSSIELVFDYLGLEKVVMSRSSSLDYDRSQTAADKLIEISKLNDCTEYINSPGGRELYEEDYFSSRGVTLRFVETQVVEYDQGGVMFFPNLSMIDVLMWNGKSDVVRILNSYRLS